MARAVTGVVATALIFLGVWMALDPGFRADVVELVYLTMLASAVVCLGLPLLWGLGFGVLQWWKFARRERVMVDGAFPLIRRVRHVWKGDLWDYVRGEEIFIDPNRVVSPVWMVDRHDGTAVEIEPAAGWAVQERYNLKIEDTNAIRAANQGDDAAWTNVFNRGRQTPRVAPHRVPKPLSEPEVVDGDFKLIPAPAPSFREAVDRTDPKSGEFPLGHDDAGGVVSWDAVGTPHLRVHGATRVAGKTNLLRTVGLVVVKFGHRLFIADRRAGKDWNDFSGHAEIVDTRRPGAFLDVVKTLSAEYRSRDALLGRERVGDVSMLGRDVCRWFLVVSEFGTTLQQMDPDARDELMLLLKAIVAEAGATGVHLLLEAQSHRDWPRDFRANITPVTGFLPKDALLGGGYSKAHELDPHQFHLDGARFRSWDVSRERPNRLFELPQFEQVNEPVITTAPAVVENAENDQFFDAGGGGNDVDLPVARQLVWGWRDSNPDGKQADMIRLFESMGINMSQANASKFWTRWKSGE